MKTRGKWPKDELKTTFRIDFPLQFKERRGDACADFAAKQLPANLLAAYRARAKEVVKMSAEKEAALIAEALAESFEVTDKAWLQMAKKKDLPDGSTGGRLKTP